MTRHTPRHETGRTPTPADWGSKALCREVDPDLFFPAPGEHEQTEQAKQVCDRCPVRTECLAWALDVGLRAGICGGVTEGERRRMRSGERQRSGEHRNLEPVAVQILRERRDEFLTLQARGFTGGKLAFELGTNVQTVNRIHALLEAESAREMGLAS